MNELPERAAIDGAQYLPLNLCRPWKLNPRKRFNQAAIDELAASIEKHGVMQPVIARLIEGAKRGGVLYEVIAGERRLRGCNIVAKRRKEENIALIPAVVRQLTDFEALELATTENLQRADLHPLEEAEGFEGLLLKPLHGGEFSPPRTQGYTVDELAAHLGKSRGYVFARLKLLALIPAARDAFYADKIIASVALLLARMPASVQQEATKKVVAGWGGQPYTFRQAQEMLEREYMLKLSSAPFKITDETLVPAAGNCKECPKRTGANPDLFDDVKSADVCTDPKCFAEKKDAHQTRLITEAKASGQEVILGKAAKKIAPHGTEYSNSMDGYMRLDKVNYNVDGSKSLEKLLGKDAPAAVLLEDPNTHDLVRVVKTTEAMQVLKDKGIVKTAKLSTRNASDRAAEAKAKAEALWRMTLAERAIAEVADPKYDEMDMHAWLLPEVAVAMWHRMDNDTEKRALKLLRWDEKLGNYDQAAELDKKLRSLRANELDQAFVAMAVAGQLHVNQYSGSSQPDRLLQIAGRLGIDGAAVRAELAAAAKAKEAKKKPPAGKHAAKATSSPASPNLGKGAKTKKSTSTKPTRAIAKSKAKSDPAAAKAAENLEPGQVDDNAAVNAHVVRVGNTLRVRRTATGRKTAKDGRIGTVLQILADKRIVLSWGPKRHERGVYAANELEQLSPEDLAKLTATANPPPAAKISDVAAWPFPNTPAGDAFAAKSTAPEAA